LIDPRAIIDPSAVLADDVEVGPWTVIGANVEIGSGTVISSHVVVKGPTTIGNNNRIFQFASIGEDCQDKKFAGEHTRLEIGDNNVFREGVTVHRGTVQDKGLTSIGNDNLFMAYSHVAHDAVLGNNIVVANSTAIAGHVHVGDWVILGGLTGIHQFCKIGPHSMTGAHSMVVKDIPAFVLVSGNPASSHGMNYEGLKRRGYTKDTINTLRKAYKLVFRQGNTVTQSVVELEKMVKDEPILKLLIDSLTSSTRGIVR